MGNNPNDVIQVGMWGWGRYCCEAGTPTLSELLIPSSLHVNDLYATPKGQAIILNYLRTSGRQRLLEKNT